MLRNIVAIVTGGIQGLRSIVNGEFDTFIIPRLIRLLATLYNLVVCLVGVILFALGAILTPAWAFSEFEIQAGVLMGVLGALGSLVPTLLALILGRIAAELALLIFDIRDQLFEIRTHLAELHTHLDPAPDAPDAIEDF